MKSKCSSILIGSLCDSEGGARKGAKRAIESKETTSEGNNNDTEVPLKSINDKIEETEKEAVNKVKKESLEKPVEKLVLEENKSIEEKSKSTASEADKTKDESKS